MSSQNPVAQDAFCGHTLNVIAQETIAQVRAQVDIVALVSEFVSLKRVGSSHKGLCPFHAEKTPSFYVHPARGYFYCFGCHAAGDAIAFWMRIQSMSFTEAVIDLANRLGVPVTQDRGLKNPHAEADKAHRENVMHAMQLAAGYFVQQLRQAPDDEREAVEQALKQRGISAACRDKFRLGYAPAGWQGLADHLVGKHGCSPAVCEHAGLIVPRQKSGGYYDRFRQRIMFPVTDVHGRVIAFSGRYLDLARTPLMSAGQQPPPKYVNSPETRVYKKGEALYGLFESRLALRRMGWAVLCEGNFDVLALHQAGFDNALAPLGTALTETQAKLLRRFAERVVVCFDGDAAGLRATLAASELLDAVGLETRIARLPDGQDPDSFIRSFGTARMRALLEEAQTRVFWLIDYAAATAGAHPAKKAEAIRSLGPALRGRKSPVEVRMYLDRLMQRFGIQDERALRAELRKGLGVRPREKAQLPPTRSKPWSAAEQEVIGALLDQPRLLDESLLEKLAILLTDTRSRSILELLRDAMTQGTDSAKAIVDKVGSVEEPTLRRWLAQRLCQEKYDAQAAAELIEQVVPQLELERGKHLLRRLAEDVQSAQKTGDVEGANRLRREHLELARKLQAKGSSSR